MKIDKQFKISIILDSTYVSKSIFELIEWLKKHPDLEIHFILIQSNRKIYLSQLSYLHRLNSILDHIAWNIVQYFESIYYKQYHSDHLKYHINFNHRDDMLDLRKIPSAEIEHSSSISSALKKLNTDLMISLNLCPYSRNLKNFSKLGLLFFDHFKSEDRHYRPIGFDEVYEKRGKTGFSILRLQKNIDSAEILFKGAFPTHNYFLANHLNILKRRNFYFKKYMFAILKKTLIKNDIEINSVKRIEKFDLPPNLLKQSIYICKSMMQRLISIKNKIFKKERFWKIGFIYSDWNDFKNNEIHIIENPINCYLADPFVIKVEDKNYCLAEEYSFDKCKGVIVAYELEGKNSKRIGEIIKEPFHMSFPYIFKFQERIFMIPETSENKDIRIYESVKFPHEWKLNQVVMKNVFAVDSMIFNFQNRWWLFSNINPENGSDACSELCIYSSNNPLSGQWQPHKLNPVMVNSDRARNGGILYKDNKIFRVSQKQNFGRYGAEFAINEIIELTKNEFTEKKISHIKPDFIKNGLATHHCHSNNDITVIDFLT